MKKLYFISGLGADRSVFEGLDLSFCTPVFIDWIAPLKNESLKSYALRLSACIEEPDATIVGLSMGGMMATEIVSQNPSMKAIIISSNRNSKQFPFYSRLLLKYLPVYKLVNKRMMLGVFPLISWFLGAKTSAQKQLLRSVIHKTDMDFVKWCLWSIARWKHESTEPNVIHIHGNADKLLPYQFIKPADYIIEKGEHLMIRNRAKEISELLRQIA